MGTFGILVHAAFVSVLFFFGVCFCCFADASSGRPAPSNLLLGAFGKRYGRDEDILQGLDQLREVQQSKDDYASHSGLCVGGIVDSPGSLA